MSAIQNNWWYETALCTACGHTKFVPALSTRVCSDIFTNRRPCLINVVNIRDVIRNHLGPSN